MSYRHHEDGANIGVTVLALPGWVVEMLGDHAREVIELIPSCLRKANERARNAQTASGLRQLNPYGNTLWLTSHDELASNIGALAGCSTYKPEGTSFWLPVVNDTVIYAYRQDSKVKGDLAHAAMEPSGIRDALVALPTRLSAEQTLDFSELDQSGTWSSFGLRTPRVQPRRALLVPFVANVDSGVLAAGIGEGNLRLDGTVAWEKFASLDLDLYRAAPQAVDAPDIEPSFDNAEIPVPVMAPRRRRADIPEDETLPATPIRRENGSDE